MYRKIKNIVSFRRLMAIVGLIIITIISLSSPLSAQTVTQGYATDEILQRGMLVSIKESDASKIEAAERQNIKRLHGIVVNQNDSPVTISGENQKTFVATVGRYEALVSDENGPIKIGDYVTVSSVPGIGKKVDTISESIIGKALLEYNSKSDVLSSTEVKDKSGGTQKISIGRIPIDISIGANPFLKPEDNNLPGFLKRAAEAIAQKPISPVRVYISFTLIVAAIAIAGSMLYAGVRSSMISIGRNPLSKKTINKSLIQVIIASFIVFIIGIFGVYLILKL